ncbi:MAG TPA: acyl-CoA dehydrogenase family protein [Streptosporangiaceae bacterium]|nr:acyl-CoA dehydrogenase family protein [Streptosporangiaceae bacterium]
MQFTLSAEQRQFSASLHLMLTAADATHSGRRWLAGDREPCRVLSRTIAETGVTALAIPAEFGGLGAHPADVLLACQELGHHAMFGPVAESVAAVPTLLAALTRARPGRIDRIEEWLAGLASGQLIATLAAPPLLPFAADVDKVGLVLLAEHGSLWVAEPRGLHRSVSPARTLSEVTGRQLIADGPEVGRALATALEFGAIACSAQLLGAASALLETTARHARQRTQFGRPIGSFQAVKHRLADVLIQLELARPLPFAAAIALADESADAPRDVSAAKVASARVANLAARAALQVHGAIGYTAEHDVSQWLTLIRALIPAWGSEAMHKARVLAALTGQSVGGQPVQGQSCG